VYLAQAIGQLVLVAVVVLALSTFHRHHRRRYLLHWSRSWLALGTYIAVEALSSRAAALGPPGPGVLLGLSTVSMVAGYLQVVWLLLGTWEIATGREVAARPEQRWLAVGLLAGSVSGVTLIAGVGETAQPLLLVGVRALVATVAFLAASAAVLSPAGPRPRALGRRLMALALAGYATNQAAYAVLILRPAPTPYAGLVMVGMFDILVQAFLALAIAIWLLEDEREETLGAFSERERKERAQACLYRISAAVHSARDLPELFRTIHSAIGEVLPARNFYIALFDPAEGMLSFPYFVDEHDTRPAPKPPGRGLTEYVLRTRKPLLATPEVFRELVTRGEVQLLFTDSVDWLGVPLLVDGEAMGVLAVQTYDREVRLGPEERDLLVFVSEQVAAAITARRSAEALRESEARLRMAVEQLPAVLWTTDEALRFTSSVGAGLAALGLRPNQVVGMSVGEYVGGDRKVLRAHRRALAGESVSFDYSQEGRTFVMRVEPLRDSAAAVSGTIGIALDVTEEKRAAARLRQVIDLVPAFIFAKDPEGRFILANRALAEAHGTTVEGLLGKTVHDLGVDPDEARHFTEDDLEVIRTGRRKQIPEERFTDATGRVRHLQTTKIPFTFSDTPALLGVAVDISERKAAEETLRRAAKEESLTVLAGGVAHDFNNLLAAVLGHVSLTLAKLPPQSPARRHAEKAAATVERASDLTRQMLAYSGRGHFVIQPTDLGTLVQESLPLLKVTLPKSVRLETVLATEVPLVDADVGQIQQVVMNLVINAGEALGERGGTVTVSTGTREVRSGEERLWSVSSQPLSPGPYVQLEVRDDGPGMDEETVSRIFDPFFTTKFTGRGLGLAAVLGVMRGHRGGLHVESRPGEGTAFQLLFVPSARAVAEPGVSAAPQRGQQLSVLLIDDEEVVRDMVAEVLEHEGLEVLVAPDGERGLELMRERGQEVDVVLLDLSMPGLGGQETFARLAEGHPGVPVILSSGYDHAEAMRRFEERAPAGFIQKPYRPAQLLAEIHRCVGDRGDGGPPGSRPGPPTDGPVGRAN
jgi:PAS domain S-box-containing protein